jgi:hypothetical protein
LDMRPHPLLSSAYISPWGNRHTIHSQNPYGM